MSSVCTAASLVLTPTVCVPTAFVCVPTKCVGEVCVGRALFAHRDICLGSREFGLNRRRLIRRFSKRISRCLFCSSTLTFTDVRGSGCVTVVSCFLFFPFLGREAREGCAFVSLDFGAVLLSASFGRPFGTGAGMEYKHPPITQQHPQSDLVLHAMLKDIRTLNPLAAARIHCMPRAVARSFNHDIF